MALGIVTTNPAPGLTIRGRFDESAAVLPRRAMVEPKENVLRKPPSAAAADRAGDGDATTLDEAMNRYASGDDAAFDLLYRHGAPRVRGFLLRLCGDVALADDLTQEAFLRVHRARGSFAVGVAALPWIFAIARNAFRDDVRRVRARPVANVGRGGDDEAARHEAAPGTRGDEALVARELLDVVRRTLATLPVAQREAFVLVRFEGLSVCDAARVLGTTEGAVKIRAFRAYEALRGAIREASGDAVRHDP